ncbi:MAG: nucleoside-triphosphatase, partial [Candidatus Bathyarchaeia archaeon]
MVELFDLEGKSTNKIALTGLPACGKTTVIQRALKEIPHPKAGFFTRDVRKGRMRMGFMIETVSGREALLAHREEFDTHHRIGPYGVFIENIEALAVRSIEEGDPSAIFIVDEIGKMECLSNLFRDTIIRLLDSDRMVLATIPVRGGP